VQFLKDNPNLKVISTEVDPNEDKYNAIDGTFIFTEPKE
jgi:hypothetical protein